MDGERVDRCRDAAPFGTDTSQRRSAVVLGRRDCAASAELAHPRTVRKDTAQFAMGIGERRIGRILWVNPCSALKAFWPIHRLCSNLPLWQIGHPIAQLPEGSRSASSPFTLKRIRRQLIRTTYGPIG